MACDMGRRKDEVEAQCSMGKLVHSNHNGPSIPSPADTTGE